MQVQFPGFPHIVTDPTICEGQPRIDGTCIHDEEIIAIASQTGETILTNDLDFSRIMALSGERFPSIITFRLGALNPSSFREIIRLNLPTLSSAVRAV